MQPLSAYSSNELMRLLQLLILLLLLQLITQYSTLRVAGSTGDSELLFVNLVYSPRSIRPN